MAFDETLAERVRSLLKRRKGFAEKKMFGGLCFLQNGNMVCGINDDKLMLRLGNDEAAAALSEKHVAPMDFTGRALKSMVFVEPAGTKSDADLKAWVERAWTIGKTMPPK